MQSPDPKSTESANSYDEEHPEQDPAEGSAEVIEHDLAEEGGAEAAKPGDAGSKGGAEQSRAR